MSNQTISNADENAQIPTMVRRGSPVQARERAFPLQRGLQPASESRLTTETHKKPTVGPEADFAAAALNYANGNDRLAEKYFARGWAGMQRQARNIAGRVLGSDAPNLIDDALQNAAVKLWKSVRRGYKADSWVAIASSAAHHAAVTVLDRRIRHRSDEYPLFDNPDTADAAMYTAQAYAGGGDQDPETRQAMIDFAATCRSRGGRQGELWEQIVLAVADGLVDRASIARRLHKPEGTIRRVIFEMRQCPGLWESLNGREVIRAVGDLAADDSGQLFEFTHEAI